MSMEGWCLRDWGMEEGEREGAITYKAYSADSSEATGGEGMEAYGCAFEGANECRQRHCVCRCQNSIYPNQMEGTRAAIRTRKRHNHIALGRKLALRMPKVNAGREIVMQHFKNEQKATPGNIIHPAEWAAVLVEGDACLSLGLVCLRAAF